MTMVEAALSKEEIQRYSRHLILPEVTLEGQKKLKASSVLCIGTGGLGAPVTMYLAAAGVGRIGLVDFDVVDYSNLQRQVLFNTDDVGVPKTQAARARLEALNPNVRIDTHEVRFSSENAIEIVEPYDIVVDGTDNFPTRYCTNDACVMLDKPNVYGSIFRFEGQATVFDPRPDGDGRRRGPCYRCLYPEPPPPGMVPSCAEGGVLGILPGVVGCIQATEAIKLMLETGESLVGRLIRYDALAMQFKQFKLHRDTDCPVCGDSPSITELIDYQQFCGIRGEESDTVIREDGQVPEITVVQLKEMLDADDEFELIDVREPHEHAICNLPEAELIPLGTVAQRMGELDQTRKYVVHCKLGGRSAQAVELMRHAGLNAINVAGGITAWAQQVDTSMPTY
ncbi:MAG: molybdopterin-synthase adenylyltransferase MoeB [Phycisphaeraceae bacterium]|jgi:adenylyltransferase/sulfurtransferase|nr:molybdopterin-synthase adenylyltransferase MoeB [Phycisphaeraceae bacterium]